MSNKNIGQPKPDDIRKHLEIFQAQIDEADQEVARTEQAVLAYRQQETSKHTSRITSQGEVAFLLDVNRTYQDLLDERQAALVARNDLEIRIGKLNKALRMMGES